FRLRDDEDVVLIRDRKLEGSNESSIPNLNQPIEDMIYNLDASAVGDPTTQPYLLNHDIDNDDADSEPAVIIQEKEDEEEEEEEEEQGINYYTESQPAYAQLAINRPYDHLAHFSSLNLESMNQGSYWFQGSPDDDPVDEFEVGQQFEDKQAIMLVVKAYNIRRVVEYIVKSDRLKYAVQRI
ncbi:hypothetical protein PIB30_068858, partial [Stylosanthes scabra]|nr:hypothetical protein [Stylosanthes scabra]